MSARQPARWTDAEGISDLSVAIDEIYFLRALLADEAGILDAHLGYATFPKSRRAIGEASVERMMRAARGEGRDVAREQFDARLALMRADAPRPSPRWGLGWEAPGFSGGEVEPQRRA